MRRRLIIALSLAVIVSATAVHAQVPPTRETLTKSGFSFSADAPVKILLVRSQIKVVEQSAAGLRQPSADLTILARANLREALAARLNQQNIALSNMPETPSADAAFIADYQNLLRAVVDTAIKHQLLSADLLPTKTSQLNWSLGDDGSRLVNLTGAEFALFINMYDTFDAPGRQSADNVAGIMGRKVMAGLHSGYAALVDLRSGDLLWINVNVQMKGDVRRADGAERRVLQLLEKFPVRSGGPVNRKSNNL